MEVHFPYGNGVLTAKVPDERIAAVIRARLDDFVPGATEEELVCRSMEHPVASPRLDELAKGKKNIVLIASDHTRPVPSKIIVPQMLAALHKGNPDAEITILIATGCHRATTMDELRRKFGDEICNDNRIVIHDCTDNDNMVTIGTLPSGAELIVNRIAYEADLLISEGFIEPHFFAGFSGGRKSLFPGVTSRAAVHQNHCSAFIDSPYARCGILDGNPIHTDMIYAAKTAGLKFIVNVVINSKKQVVGSFAGDVDLAHRAGTEFLSKLVSAQPIPSDMVITTNNGYPLDQNVYQTVKGMTTAESTCNPGGVIIMVAKCEDGCGGDSFYNTFRNNRSPEELLVRFRATVPHETVEDQWQSQIFARILSSYHVILVSDMPDSIVSDMHMIPAATVEEAIRKGDELLGRANCPIAIIPEGITTMFVD